MKNQYKQVTDDLRGVYDQDAPQRDKRQQSRWRERIRRECLQQLQAEGKNRLLEIGAGPGNDSAFFAAHNMQVVATDLSPGMIELCQQKGLEAYVMDFLNLDFPANSFDAGYGINCLLHVPKPELPTVLMAIRGLLKPNGLFLMGLYGGIDRDGPWENDLHEPKRYFALYPDAEIQKIVKQTFTLEHFEAIDTGDDNPDIHFQMMILRKL